MRYPHTSCGSPPSRAKGLRGRLMPATAFPRSTGACALQQQPGAALTDDAPLVVATVPSLSGGGGEIRPANQTGLSPDLIRP